MEDEVEDERPIHKILDYITQEHFLKLNGASSFYSFVLQFSSLLKVFCNTVSNLYPNNLTFIGVPPGMMCGI